MNFSILYRLLRFVTTYHLLTYFLLVFLTEVSGISAGKSEIRTKLLLQNIRQHLAQKADEIVQKKECESGFTLCNLKNKETETDKSEEIPPPPKIFRGHHKPVIKVTSKDVIQTMIPKAHKGAFRKAQKEKTDESQSLNIALEEESEESTEISLTDKKSKKTEQTITKLPELRTENEDSTRQQQHSAKLAKPESKPLQVKTLEKAKTTSIKIALDKKQSTDEKKEKSLIEKEKPEKVKKVFRRKETESEKTKENISESTFPGETFVFFLNSDVIENSLCRKHIQVFSKQFQKYKIWALMMFDASAKIPSGILQGNFNQLGDFDECLSINAVFKKLKFKFNETSSIRGKYCLANLDVSTTSESEALRQVLNRAESFSFVRSTIDDPGHFIPRFTSINWGICVPSVCPADDVEKFLKSRLKVFNETSGLSFKVRVEDENCVAKDDLKVKWDVSTSLTIILYAVIVLAALFATYCDSKNATVSEEVEKKTERIPFEAFKEKTSKEVKEHDKEIGGVTYNPFQGKPKRFLMAFSLRRNWEKLFGDRDGGDSIKCINGIKSICTIMLYFAHKTIPLGMTPFSNRISLTKISNEATTVLLRTSIIYTDSFLLISGLLISYSLAKEIAEKGKIFIWKKFLARFIRLTPPLLAVTLFYAYVWQHLGSGPMWNQIVKKNSDLCRNYQWRNLLYIQNFFAFENMCAPQTHQLALDMQLFILAPFFVYVLHKYDKVGIGILQALFLISSIMRYISTSNNNLSVVIYHGMPVSTLYRTANLLYTQTLHRASPYILGSITGYYLRKFENQFEMPKAFFALGWIIAFSLGFYSIVSPSNTVLKNYQYELHEAAQYAALSPVAWSMALCWMIYACHSGYGGKLNDFLCHKVFLVFSRISYSVYLTQFLVFFYKVGVKRVQEMFTFTGSFNLTEFFVVIVSSTIVTLLFDLPMMEIKKILLNEKSTKRFYVSQESENPKEEQSENFQTEEENQLQQQHQDEEDLDYQEELLEEMNDNEVVYEDEEEEEEDDESGEEEVGDEEVDEDTEEKEEKEFATGPLRRSSRIYFNEETEETDWLNVKDDTEEKI